MYMSQEENIKIWPGVDLLNLVDKQDGVIASFKNLSLLQTSESSRASFRLNLVDGRVFKGRQFVSTDKMSSLTKLLGRLQEFPFSPLIASQGIATLETWIEGVPLAIQDVQDEHIAMSASILCRLHNVDDFNEDEAFMPVSNRVSLDRVKTDIQKLKQKGLLLSGSAENLIGMVEQDIPVDLEMGIIHTDLHPGNMVVTPDGKIVVIDNEHLDIGPLDYDVARTWSRWPMNGSQRKVFRTNYEEFRSFEPFLTHERFWAIQSLSRTASIQARFGRVNQMALDRLQLISRASGEGAWPAAAH
jgi:thiamine kinase-like enzyme